MERGGKITRYNGPLLQMCVISIINMDATPKSELTSRAVPSVEAHHRSVGPDAGRNSRGMRKKMVLGAPINRLEYKTVVTFPSWFFKGEQALLILSLVKTLFITVYAMLVHEKVKIIRGLLSPPKKTVVTASI